MTDDAKHARATIFEIIENQIRENSPPQTKATLDRLISEGIPREEAMKLIACALVDELYEIMNSERTYDESRYVANLEALPKLPWDE